MPQIEDVRSSDPALPVRLRPSFAAPSAHARAERAGPTAEVPRRGRARALLALARPRQWIKNALVIAAPAAAGALGHDDMPARLALTCVAFCALSAGVYALNDVRDRDEDRRHPRKRLRPVARGEIAPRDALGFGLVATIGGVVLCFAVTPELALVGAGYVALTLSYSWVWRRVVWLDLAALAGGFLLRAIAGGVAAPVGLSRWFVAVVAFAAVFVAAGKRLAELQRARAFGVRPRHVLLLYSRRSLHLTLAASSAATLLAYGTWALELPVVDGVPWRLISVVPFVACLLRYVCLVRAGEGEAPEEAMLSDPGLLTAGLAWVLVFALGVTAAT
ncbi:MAG: decaprenyl-phosphate phosphoribosyltransferase [Solirubrobacteraceae bacterium]